MRLPAWFLSGDDIPMSATMLAEYRAEQAARTLSVGRWLSGMTLVLMPLVMRLDPQLPGMVEVRPWRLLALSAAFVFMVYSFVKAWRRPLRTFGLHFLNMLALMWCLCGLNISVLTRAPLEERGIAYVGVQGALLLGVFAAFAFASGVRRLLPLVFGLSMGPTYVWFAVSRTLTVAEWSLFMDPTIVAVAAMILSRKLDRQVRQEFMVRRAAETSRAELELRLEELKEANRRLQAEAEARRRLEAELRRHAQELATSNVLLEQETERHRVTADRLEGHARTLRRSNELLEQFTYVASHDLKEPLRTVSSFLKLIGRRLAALPARDPKLDEYLDTAASGALRMDRLIDALLSYSRLSTRSEPFAPVDLNPVVGEASVNLKAALAESGGAILSGVLPTAVLGDRDQLVTLFQNLFSNALRYRRNEVAPQIQVSGHFEGDVAHVSVADNGIGIAAEYHERIFQVFQRLHSRGEYEGTGMGLAIVRRIVEGHGGRLWVESEPGQGSTFHFTLAAGEGK
ncbi:MAG: hypothetical protein FJ109_10420 [Deltaproteobacteria bacterium]|nr:hypothetical protein [Deltaproteobacteria bacterium]